MYFGDNRTQAIVAILITCSAVLGVISGLIEIFIRTTNLNAVEEKLFAALLIIPFYFYFDYRYRKKKSIVNGRYRKFRERWGNPENVSKKNLKILLIYTLIATIGVFIYAAVMGTLNKHGYFEGCRLFP